ncbi:ABC transporter permease [Bacillus carboniphilus]|uniref:ABC transporter permease n=1 Tax=Bacillus carboniphilus TaxID=86663 RepID=A0ABN0VRH5_9BACI
MKTFHLIKTNLLFFTGLLMLLILLLLTFVGPFLPFVDSELEEVQYIWTKDKIPLGPPFEPSEEFPLGSDRQGRDILSIVVMGAKETLFLVVMITIIRYVVALPLSFLAHRNVLGARFVLNWLNGLLSYVPTIIIVVLLAMLPPIMLIETRPLFLLLIIALVEVGRAADMIKLEFDELSSKEFMQSGISGGAKSFTLFKSYYLPFLYGKILIYMITDLGRVMFLLGQLGFIGIFISQVLVQVEIGYFEIVNESTTWPALLVDSFRDIRAAVWIPFYPALAMTYTILTFNILAQGLQNLFNRKNSYI